MKELPPKQVKVTMTFSLPDNKYEYEAALYGGEAFAVIQTIKDHIRNKLKYGPLNSADEELEEIRALLVNELLFGAGVIS